MALMTISFLLFLFLSFWTLDAAMLCRRFINRLTRGPTVYSLATRQHFSRQRGGVAFHVLAEWIDVRIIAEITNQVGMLLYFPAALLLLILVASNNAIYYIEWRPIYRILVACHFALAAASVVVLQRSAVSAREQSIASLTEKINQLKARAAVTKEEKEQHNIFETEALLTDIQSLKAGAFGGFWSNPVVGALLVPSGGAGLIQIISYFLNR